jgi:hypothetical protein
VFIHNHAVSWYADKDFANVGQTLAWIVADEATQLARIKALPATQVFSSRRMTREMWRRPDTARWF